MSETLSRCQNCGVEFQMPQDEVVSSRILCPPCAAERRAKLRAAKAAGATEAADGGRAAAPAQARTAATTEAGNRLFREEDVDRLVAKRKSPRLLKPRGTTTSRGWIPRNDMQPAV